MVTDHVEQAQWTRKVLERLTGVDPRAYTAPRMWGTSSRPMSIKVVGPPRSETSIMRKGIEGQCRAFCCPYSSSSSQPQASTPEPTDRKLSSRR